MYLCVLLLRSLNVGRTAINSWQTLDALRQFPSLVDVRLHSIPCAEVIVNGVKFYLLSGHSFRFVIGVHRKVHTGLQ